MIHGDNVILLLFSWAGCLLDFLKSDKGKTLKTNKLIDMSAQVGHMIVIAHNFKNMIDVNIQNCILYAAFS